MSISSRPWGRKFYRIRSLHPAQRKFHCRIKSHSKFLPFAGILCDKAPVACLAGNDKTWTPCTYFPSYVFTPRVVVVCMLQQLSQILTFWDKQGWKVIILKLTWNYNIYQICSLRIMIPHCCCYSFIKDVYVYTEQVCRPLQILQWIQQW
jgi:hypothetical protein